MQQIGDYLVKRLIGEGGMGKVYEAEERLSKRRVALKVLRPELGRSDDGRRMFLSEMTILAHLDHPNIVRSLASTEVNGELVMVLEYLDGRTLRDLLVDRGRLSWIEAVDVTLQVAAALRAAHGQEPPIIHRDLKPENLMILPDGRVVVMDFGIAKVLAAIRHGTTHSVGTLQYMSPEQIDAGAVDGRTDLYCLGLICYEMLAGRPPFESASPRELLNLQCTQPPPPLPDDVRGAMPRGVEQTLLRMLAKAPGDRPADAAAVIGALEPFGSAGGTALATAPAARAAGASAGHTGLAVASTVVGSGRASTGGASAGWLSGSRTDPGAASRHDLPARPAGGEPEASGRRAERQLLSRGVAAASPTEPGPPRADTVALIERASRPRELSARVALVLVALLCVLAGVATYAARAVTAGRASAAAPDLIDDRASDRDRNTGEPGDERARVPATARTGQP